jgi:hypothetical protein
MEMLGSSEPVSQRFNAVYRFAATRDNVAPDICPAQAGFLTPWPLVEFQ